MQTIRIILSAAKSLQQEKLELADLVENLNHSLESRNANILMLVWDGSETENNDFKDMISDTDLCLTLYYDTFDESTQSELETAYQSLCEGKNPKKIYVYFKEGETVPEQLKTFRDSFPTKYGHFYCSFSNIDTLKADFLLQFMEYQSKNLGSNKMLEVNNGKVTIDGKEYVDLKNVPFAGNNEEYNLLLKSIKKTQKLLAITEEDDPDYADYAADLQDMKEKLAKMESSLWNTALMITRLCSTRCSERLKRAMDLFSMGDNKGAQAVLNEYEIEKDVEHNLNLIKLGEEGRKGLATNIEEYRLKIKTIENEMVEGWYHKADELYNRCLVLGKDNLDKEEYASLLSDYGDFLMGECEYEKVEETYKESLSILYELEQKENHNKLICWNLRQLSVFYINSNQYTLAEKVLSELLEFLKDTNNSEEKAAALYHLAYLHSMMLKYELAERELKKAIVLAEGKEDELNNDVLTECLYQLGLLYKTTKRLNEAEEYANKSLKLYINNRPDIKDSFVARIYQLLGNIYSLEGKSSMAIEMHNKSEEINRELMKNDPNAYGISLVCDLGNLSGIHAQIGDYDMATQELEEAMEIIAVLFKKYPLQYSEYYARVVQDLAYLLKNTKKYKEATDLLKKSLEAYEILKNTDAERHLFQLAHALNLQGCIFLENKEYLEADEALRSALVLRKELSQKYGDHYLNDVAQTLTNIALLNCDTAHFEESEKQYFELIEIYKFLTDKYGQHHEIDMAIVYLNLAWLYFKQRQYDQSIKFGVISIETFQSTPDSIIIDKYQFLSLEAKALYNLSVAFSKNEMYNDAVKTIEKSIEITIELSHMNPTVYEIQLSNNYNELAWYKYKLGDYASAEEIAQKSFNIATKCKIKPKVRMSLDTLACIHREIGKYDIAEKEFQECISLCQELLLTDDQLYKGKLAHEYIELAKLYKKWDKLAEYTISIDKASNYLNALDENHMFDFQDDIKELYKIKKQNNNHP